MLATCLLSWLSHEAEQKDYTVSYLAPPMKLDRGARLHILCLCPHSAPAVVIFALPSMLGRLGGGESTQLPWLPNMWLTGGIVSRLSGGILGTSVAMTAASTSHGRQQWPWLATHSNSSREEGIHVHTNLGSGPCYLSLQGLLSVSGSGKILVILVGSSS